MSETTTRDKCPECGSIPRSKVVQFYNTFLCESGYYHDKPEMIEQSAECKTRVISSLRTKLAAAEKAERALREAAKESMNAASEAWTDIKQWCKLATYQRMQSDNPSHDPLCATSEAFERSRRVCLLLGNANAAIRALLASPEREEGRDD